MVNLDKPDLINEPGVDRRVQEGRMLQHVQQERDVGLEVEKSKKITLKKLLSHLRLVFYS